MISRTKAIALAALTTLTQDEHELLKKNGAADNKYWGTKIIVDQEIIGRFRAEIKQYYYSKQLRRCCYCSKEFDNHALTYDAEHVIDQSTFPQFMFELTNFSAACKMCNGAKSSKNVLIGAIVPLTVPLASADYTIVHPHLDEWDDFLHFDVFSRIIANGANSKGVETIKICGIFRRNAARLADYFYPADNAEAEKILESFFTITSIPVKEKRLALLRKMADEFNLAKARAIVNILDGEMKG
jgi:hypothetical protein